MRRLRPTMSRWCQHSLHRWSYHRRLLLRWTHSRLLRSSCRHGLRMRPCHYCYVHPDLLSSRQVGSILGWPMHHRGWTRCRPHSRSDLHRRMQSSPHPWQNHVILAALLLRGQFYLLLDQLCLLQKYKPLGRMGLEDCCHLPTTGTGHHTMSSLHHQ